MTGNMNRPATESILNPRIHSLQTVVCFQALRFDVVNWKKGRERRGPFQFNKAISHPDSEETSIYKTDSLSIGYRLRSTAFKMKSLRAEIDAKRRIKAAWGWWNSQGTDARMSANSKDRNNRIGPTKLHELDVLTWPRSETPLSL